MIKTLLTNLKMTGALEALGNLDALKDREPFLIALLQAELETREARSNKRRLSQAKFPTDK